MSIMSAFRFSAAEGAQVFFILQLDMVRLRGKGKGGRSGASLSVS